MSNRNTTSILYVGKRKHRDYAKKLLNKGVQLGLATKPDNSTNLFVKKGNTTSVRKNRKALFKIPCGMFMTDDAVLPLRLSKIVPVFVLVRSTGDTRTRIFYKGKNII